jgi:hypothetical protein
LGTQDKRRKATAHPNGSTQLKKAMNSRTKSIKIPLLHFLVLVAPVLAILGMSGCSNVAISNNSNLLNLNIGDTKNVLRQKMGLPKRNEQYSNDGKAIEIWYYRTGYIGDGGLESDAEFTPVVMKDGVVVGWGRSYYDNSLRIKTDITIKSGKP